jgi:2-polyprenyl-3-methyl-5-hydroxy-6-metoxy-1,4-benzoquinol methylase
VIYLNANSSQKTFLDIYNENYFKNNYLPLENSRKDFYSKQLDVIDKLKPEKGRLLDIGCGVGGFIKAAQEKGWNVLGIEPSKFASSYAKKAVGLELVINASLKEANLSNQQFDVITLWDVIAHFPNLKETFNLIHNMLKSHGLLVIKTPCRPRHVFIIARFLALAKQSMADTILHLPMQLYHFNPQSARAMIETFGFAKLEIKSLKEPLTRIKRELKEPPRFRTKVLITITRIVDALNVNDSMIIYAAKAK